MGTIRQRFEEAKQTVDTIALDDVLAIADQLDREQVELVKSVGALPRFEMKDWESGALMVETKAGEYLEREAVLKALKPK